MAFKIFRSYDFNSVETCTLKYFLLYKLECFIGISSTEKNSITTLKNDDNFLRVFEMANPLLTHYSLCLAPWVNGNGFEFSFWNVNVRKVFI